MVKRTGVVGHKSLSTKRPVVESLSDIETFNFKTLLTYHFLIPFRHNIIVLCWVQLRMIVDYNRAAIIVQAQSYKYH